jgi:hypothetical protein
VDVRFLRKLCNRVTPGSLRLGLKEPRRRTFLLALDRVGKDLVLKLDPVARCAPAARAVLDFSDGERQFWVAGALVPTAKAGAQLILESGPVERAARATRVIPAGDVAFAMFVSGAGRQCLPALDVSARGMRVESAVPLQLGTVLGDLIVLFRQEVLRTGEGVSTSCSPALYPDGRLVYECGVRIRGSTTPRMDYSPSERVEIDDAARVRAILWGLCDLQYEVTLSGPTGVVRGRIQQHRGVAERGRAPELRCKVDDADRIPIRSGTVTVECSLFGSGYCFFARVIERRGDVLTLSPAPKLREWHRRGEERTSFAADAGATVSFRHPLTDVVRKRMLVDLSSHGFSFEPRHGDDDLWPGLPLADVRIALGGNLFKPGQVALRSVSTRRVSVEMRDLAERDADILREQLVERGKDPVTFHDGRSLETIVDFHRAMALLEPAMDANLTASFAEARRSWRLAHAAPARLMRTTVVPWRGGIGATLTSVRAYERTWILQHSAVASAAVPAGAGQLHGVLMRLAAHRNDGEYVAGYIDAGARTLHSMVDAFFTKSAPAHRGATRFTLYGAEATSTDAHGLPTLRRLRGRDELLVEHAAERLLDPVCARALGLRAGEIELTRTRAAFRKIGVQRDRRAFGVFAGGACVAILLRETASPGLCLSGLLSASMLLPVLPEADPDGTSRRALAHAARAAEVPGAPPYRFLFLPAGADDGPLLAEGFRAIGECTFFALHRLGIVDYQRYVANKYGLLHARLRGRAAHVADAA